MNGPGRLSLRARLLVVLIAVTAAFLLIMGGVTAFVLSKRLSTHFDDALISAAARTPDQIQANPGDDVAVLITHRFPPTVQPLTGSTATTEELVNAIEKMAAAGRLRGNLKDIPFVVPGTSPRLRAVARPVRSNLSAQGAVRPRLAAVLVVASPVDVVAGQVRGIVVTELITGGALILLLALGGRWLIGRGLAPLSEMAGTAQRITTQGDLTARMPDADGSTEVGRLGTAINTMLDRIQQAFGARLRSEAKVRQFAADASHELRTPLTTIRGYAELYRQGALDHDQQLPDAMRRIEQEARRMSTLVAELLELARLDRTTSLDITETDLAVLVRDAAADARAVEPARPVRAEAPEALVAVVDEARIRQVLANLLGNVREHTPVTTPTAVRLAQVRGGVVLEVADSGPGMAAEDAVRAFDRFHRGTERRGGEPAADPAVGYGDHGNGAASPPGAGAAHSANGSRPAAESGGSGLGLAIVAAIAQAHGGQATLESAPGHGTRVRVWLPATAPATPAPPPVAATPRPSRVERHPTGMAATPQPGNSSSHQAAPPPRRPLSGPAGYPAPPPPQALPGPAGHPACPARQPLSGPADHPAWPARQPLSGPTGRPARPAQRSLPGLADYPAPMYAAPPAPASQSPPAGPPRPAPPPAPHRGQSLLPAPPGPPAPAPPVPRPGEGYPGPAELHHDWRNPPRSVPPAGCTGGSTGPRYSRPRRRRLSRATGRRTLAAVAPAGPPWPRPRGPASG